MIAELRSDGRMLQSALADAPRMTVQFDRVTATDTVPPRKFFWAREGDFEAFEAGLDDDPTVQDPERITKTPDGRYYRVVYSSQHADIEAHRAAVELDGVVLEAKSEGNGWTGRIRFPDRESLNDWCDRCEAAGISIDVKAVYDQERQSPGCPYELTDQQREALVAAAGNGYFSIPRETSLAGVGEELDVSSQAASERLRRGMVTLIENTLCENEK